MKSENTHRTKSEMASEEHAHISDEDGPCPPHCCCCGHYEPCCDCGEIMPSKACIGEKCWCGMPAAKKVGEEILFDDPSPARHNLTTYVCAAHYAQLMGPAGARQVGFTRHYRSGSSEPVAERGQQNLTERGGGK